MIKVETSRLISNMRFPLIVMVVVMHCMGNTYYMSSFPDVILLDSAHHWNFYFFTKRLIYNLSTIAVPVFFIISGYLFFAGTFGKEEYVGKLKRRIGTLLIPYVIWNLVMYLPVLLRGNSHPSLMEIFWSSGNPWYHGINYLGGEFIPAASPLNYPLWYVRDLMVLCLMSPLIYWAIKRLKIVAILIPAVLYVSYIWPHIEFNCEALLFFMVGAYLSVEQRTIIVSKKAYGMMGIATAVLGLSLALYNTLNTQKGFLIRPYYTLVGSIFFINIMQRFKGVVKPKLTEAVFAIYVLHAVIVKIVDTALSVLGYDTFKFDHAGLAIVFDCFFYPVLIILICIFIYYIIKIILPSVSKILFGNR